MLAQTPTEVRHNPFITKADQLKVFEALAKVINDVYVYPDFNGLDWPTVVAEFRANVARGLDTETFYADMQMFVRKLGDEHSYFEPPAAVAADKASLSGANDFVGIGALMMPLPEKQRVTLLAVFPGSAAERSGLREHDDILSVDGLPMVENGVVYQQRTRGPACSAAVFTVQSPGQAPRDIPLVRHRINAPMPIRSRLVKTTDGSHIGYVFLPSFFDITIPEQVKRALIAFGPLQGLIIDNRMNNGGSSSVLVPVLRYFTSGTLGHFVSRTAARRPLEIEAEDINNSQKLPLVILVGKNTVSYGEVFSGVLQDLGRARIVGRPTSGHVETLHGYNFPDGSRAWIAQERFDAVHSHNDWRRVGIKPDVEADADWDTFTASNDPTIPVAVKLLGHE